MALPAQSNGKPASNSGDNDTPTNLRRSTRARKPRVLEEDKDATYTQPKPKVASKSPSVQPEEPTRRNPKRKVVSDVFDLPDYLLESSLEAWQENEQEDWPSWSEVESDPAFFNRILDAVGVKEAKIQEVYSVDPESLAQIPAPVYGLIFLYQYVEEEPVEEPDDPNPNLWFANQTTSNACATVALFNIIMNAEGLALGEKLEKFKQESADLVPALRGNLLSSSSWIRVAHNSFARRLDLLNSALSLQNQVEDSKLKRGKGRASKGGRKTKPKPLDNAAYHFIAFIPVGQKVWQLDGLQPNPRCIGEFTDDQHWTSVVSSVLLVRMLQDVTGMLSFNLLALHGDVEPETNGEAEAGSGRKKDHTPAIHEWVKKLADHGVLGRLHEQVQMQNSQ